MHFMRASVIREKADFSATRKLVRLELGPKTYFCTVGFDNPAPLSSAKEISVDPAFLTVLLYELGPRPRATVAEIRNVVEATDLIAESSYAGHDFEAVSALFPPVRVFELPAIPNDATWKIFFKICVEECGYSDSWIEAELSETLQSISDLDPDKIPYRVLCRSIFDGDPTSFFLALYRCLEALYAFASAQKVVSALQLKQPWSEVAAVLENELGWYPREEGSLENLLRMAGVTELKAVCGLLSEIDAGDDEQVAANRAARCIYRLRNSIVHFRPAQHAVDFGKIDWNRLCLHMAVIVLFIYAEVFSAY
jgi:hypothetical protein